MMDIVKYGAIAGLAIFGTLATGGTASAAVLAGGLAVASKGVEQICETVGKENKAQPKKGLVGVLRDNSKGKSLQESRERAKKGLPPAVRRDKRIAGR
ncbi:MAG: hypothetical protein IKL32_02020 [Alphaproteobacteria bacterium]|nr:hypothetical protein [Alphaproteobacteria bacterium]